MVTPVGRPSRADLVADPVERRELARRERARALEDRVDQVRRRLGERIVAGKLVDADDMLEQEALVGDGRRVGHAGSPTLRGWSAAIARPR